MIGSIFDFIIEYLFFYIFSNKTIKEKNNKILIPLLLFSAYATFGTAYSYSWHYHLLGFLVIALFSRLLLSKEKTLFTILYSIIHTLFNIIITYITDIVSFKAGFSRIVLFILLKELQLIIFLTASNIIIYIKEKRKLKLNLLLILLFPLLFTSAMILAQVDIETNGFYIIICINITSVILSSLLYVLLGNEKVEDKKEYDFDEQYIYVLEEQITSLSHAMHDVKNHYSVIKMLDKTEEVKEYIEEISAELSNESVVMFTGNKVLDILLSKYKKQCEEKKITFYADIHTSNLNYIDDRILTGLISNLLDNAVQSAQCSQEKKINIYIQNHNELDILTIDNSCDSNYEYGEYLPTIKKDYKMHGHGMHLIKKYCKKINADYNRQFSKEKHLFKTTIVFHRI